MANQIDLFEVQLLPEGIEIIHIFRDREVSRRTLVKACLGSTALLEEDPFQARRLASLHDSKLVVGREARAAGDDEHRLALPVNRVGQIDAGTVEDPGCLNQGESEDGDAGKHLLEYDLGSVER